MNSVINTAVSAERLDALATLTSCPVSTKRREMLGMPYVCKGDSGQSQAVDIMVIPERYPYTLNSANATELKYMVGNSSSER